MRRKRPKAEAARIASSILETAVKTAGRDLTLAKKEANLARDVMLKFNVRLDWSERRFYCHGCKALIVPGVNARVRLGGHGRRVLLVTCAECGHVNRKVIEQKRR